MKRFILVSLLLISSIKAEDIKPVEKPKEEVTIDQQAAAVMTAASVEEPNESKPLVEKAAEAIVAVAPEILGVIGNNFAKTDLRHATEAEINELCKEFERMAKLMDEFNEAAQKAERVMPVWLKAKIAPVEAVIKYIAPIVNELKKSIETPTTQPK